MLKYLYIVPLALLRVIYDGILAILYILAFVIVVNIIYYAIVGMINALLRLVDSDRY